MEKAFYIFLLIISTLIQISVCEVKRVSIKSHTIITIGLTTNNVNGTYDNNMSTKGSFYSLEEKYIQVDFDLGKNYVIDKLLVTLESELKELSFRVGNLINGEGGLLYNCFNKIKATNTFECIPKCRNEVSSRNGILARKLLMKFLVKGWASIYELEVYAKLKTDIQNSISAYRYVYPDECPTNSWLLTSSTGKENELISQAIGTKIFLEKHYVITELEVEFKTDIPQNFEIRLFNGVKKSVHVVIKLEKCATRRSRYTCSLDRDKFPTRIVELISSDVIRISFRGKPVFYPTLHVSTSTKLKENLYVTCKINKCDPSVHSDCSESSMNSGVQFPCSNKRLLRVPTDSELDSFVIVNQGEVEKVWSETKFGIKSNEYDKLIVSMPRNYQYFGQYQCSCLVADEPSTEIKSSITSLAEIDFLENLIFKTKVQYKLDENDNTFNDSFDNLLIIREKELKNTFIAVKITAFSLVKNIAMNITYPKDNVEYESIQIDTYKLEKIKAFANNSQSWSVTIYKYHVDEIYPEFIHKKDIKINYVSKKHNLSQKSAIRFLKINEETSAKPEMSKTVTKKSISIKSVYTGWDSLKLMVNKETCSKSFNTTLAVFGRKVCDKIDPRVECFHHSDGAIVSITDERNAATKYKYYVLNTATNQILSEISVNRSMTSLEKGMKVKVGYTNIYSDPLDQSITVLEVELEFVSKIIQDFIPCGNVLLKIMEQGQNPKETVLQNPKYKFTVNLIKPFVLVTIKIEIDGMKTNFTKELNITDPTRFRVTNIEIQGSSTPKVQWKGLDKIVQDLLVGYEVKSVAKIVACNTSEEKMTFVNGANDTIYQTNLDPMKDRLFSNLNITVQPIYKNNKRGQISQGEKDFKNIGRTKVVLDQNISPREKYFTLVPFQFDLPCEIGVVDFEITSPELEKVSKSILKVDGKKYKISNLVPGRNYELKAQIHYRFGEPDIISKLYTFNTSYDISIAKAIHVAQVGEKVNITCEADVGPDDKFRKVIEWRRADMSELPEGVISVYHSSQPNFAFLIMEKSLADFSGDYGCIVKSNTGQGSSQINIIVNDLVVNPDMLKVNFNEVLEPISTKCHSSTIGDGKLIWTDSDNMEIEPTENEKYKIVNKIIKKEVIESTLIIKTPSLSTSGIYNCHKSIGEFKASKMFKLIGEQKLEIITLNDSSSIVGEKTRLRCKGQLGMKNQKVVWEIKGLMDNNNQNLIKKSYFNSSNLSIQDIEIINNLALHKISCILLPSLDITSSPIEKSYIIKLFPKIDVNGPESILVGSSANLTCVGYPIRKTMILQWVFYNKKTNNRSNSGFVLLTSENQSHTNSHEPITLVLPLYDVQDNGTGYYECQFKNEMRSNEVIGKSLRLSVYSKPKPLGGIKQKKSANTFNLKGNLTKFIHLLIIFYTMFFHI